MYLHNSALALQVLSAINLCCFYFLAWQTISALSPGTLVYYLVAMIILSQLASAACMLLSKHRSEHCIHTCAIIMLQLISTLGMASMVFSPPASIDLAGFFANIIGSSLALILILGIRKKTPPPMGNLSCQENLSPIFQPEMDFPPSPSPSPQTNHILPKP